MMTTMTNMMNRHPLEPHTYSSMWLSTPHRVPSVQKKKAS